MNKQILRKTSLFLFIVGLYGNINACAVNITNDGANPVLIVEKEGKYAHMVLPGESKEVGSKAFFANFYLYEQVNTEFIPKYTVDQASCNLEKFQDITTSDIMHNAGDVALYFTVTPADKPVAEKPCCHKDN